MTIAVRLETSHLKSSSTPFEMGFRLVLVPESTAKASNFHYVILLDTSSSMKDKFSLAVDGMRGMIERMPKGNFVSIITFSDEAKIIAEHVSPDSALSSVVGLVPLGRTALFSALNLAAKIANRWEDPTKIIVLTDGFPTDVPIKEAYGNIKFPERSNIIAIGVGTEYNEEILQSVVEKSNGIFYHIESPEEIPDVFTENAVEEISAKDVRVELTSPSSVSLINFSSNPIYLGFLEGVVRIYGKVHVPSNFSGAILTVKVVYQDAVTNRKIEQTLQANVTPSTSHQEFLSSINKEVQADVNYQSVLMSLPSVIDNSVEATKKLTKLNELANQTKRLDIIEYTRKLSQDVENTKKLGSSDSTKKLVYSEVTRKLRSNSE
ncbi:hypothetical protein HS7_00250 [Sulfolobales archaeon HS-7]|nr:hypothetical protein HS7_00250 [Sulfolobales archaeon HS-7]